MKIKLQIFLFLIVCCPFYYAQESKSLKEICSVHGYISYMPSATFLKLNDVTFDHLIHNRLNLKGDFSPSFTIKVELRNRIFFGNTVGSSQPIYGDIIGRDNGQVDLSYLLINNNDVIVNTMIDRAQLNFHKGKFELTAGRQRINWGINLLWNANDLFNAYNFVDFDYQERPGADAVRVQYYTGNLSSVDFAFKPGKTIDETIIAGLYKFNKWKYDFQLLGGNYNAHVALGGGWAGNIKNAGFKGEGTFFIPKPNSSETATTLLSSVSVDYSFTNGIYLNGSFLFNSGGVNSASNAQRTLLSGNLYVKNLMPTKYSYFIQISGSFNPKWGGSMATIYGQGMNFFFLMPALTYSIKQNWDADATGQIYLGEHNNRVQNLGNALFIRVKGSF